MIAKRSKREGRSSFKKLARYILDGDKTKASWAANCTDDLDLELCIKEIEANQDLNTRSKADKTYHLIVSFPEGERPSLGTIRDIESTLAKGLGYGEHQRICTTHDDTRHLHLHMAISRIHPLSLNNVEPYRDFQKLQSMCQELERKHGLQRIERPSHASRSPIIEVRQAMQSFESWLKENVRGPLDKALSSGTESWETVHKLLARFDVGLRERGAGTVLCHRKAKLFVPASRVHRNFSNAHLERVLGPFAPCAGEYPSQISYKLLPLLKSEAAIRLFEAYSQEKEILQTLKCRELDVYRARSTKDYQEVIQNHRKRCLELRFDRIIHPARKREIFALYSKNLRKQLADLKVKRSQERKAIFERAQLPYWEAWLQQKAQAGSEPALSALRDARRRREPAGNLIEIKGPRIDRLDTVYPGTVALDGSVRYVLPGGSSITDFGSKIRVDGQGDEVIKAALAFALRRRGLTELAPKGDADFVNKFSFMNAQARKRPRENLKDFER